MPESATTAAPPIPTGTGEDAAAKNGTQFTIEEQVIIASLFQFSFTMLHF
jgi:hypothetical protein